MTGDSQSGRVPPDVRANYLDNGQGHVFQYVDSGFVSDAAEVDTFVAQLREIDPVRVNELYNSTARRENITPADTNRVRGSQDIEPIDSFSSLDSASPERRERWWNAGLKSVADGRVAVVVLSGGQGTRLGFNGPKGMYDIGLPSGKTLFQLQAERLRRVCELAREAIGGNDVRIPWYIMTSPLNNAATRAFFASHDWFGLPSSDVVFFAQGTLPCLTPDGKIMLESAARVAVAPDGNGGIYSALEKEGALDDMRARGIEVLHVFAIDNALVRVADPYFLGYCIENEADCGNKSVWKAKPDEKVGVVVKRKGKPCVVEYSEMTTELCERRDSEGKLVFGAGNICNHYFSRAFLEDTVLPGMADMYHVASKKIPVAYGPYGETRTPTENNGIKLESFIFDVFPMSKRMVLFEACRADEFAPVKNVPGSPNDSPDTAREMISAQAKRWAQAAGAELGTGGACDGTCEVSPLVSYGGEGLEEHVSEISSIPFCLA